MLRGLFLICNASFSLGGYTLEEVADVFLYSLGVFLVGGYSMRG